MDAAVITILITGLLNLVLAIRQSKCTHIDSSCCCCELSLDREVQSEDEQVI